MKALLAATALLLTGPGTAYFDGMPPARFRGVAIVKLVVVKEQQLAPMCGTEVPEGMTLKGCARSDWMGRPYIVIADPCPSGYFEETARILCHELSHVRGWPANHPE